MTDREMTQAKPIPATGTKCCTAKCVAAVTAAICAGSAAVSCVNIESTVPDGGNTQIVFNLSPVKTGTKAATFETFPTTSTFGSIAMLLPEGKNWIDNSEESTVYIGGTAAGSSSTGTGVGTNTGTGSTGAGTGTSTGTGSTGTGTGTMMTGEEISWQDGVWKAWKSGAIYWWPRTGTLSFFSWSPYNLVDKGLSFNTTDGLRIDGWTMLNKAGYGSSATDGCVDILTARNLDCRRGTSGSSSGVTGSSVSNGVSTIFKHALCKVSFVISLDYDPEDGKVWTVEKVVLKDIYTTGNFVSTTWNSYSDAKDYTYGFDTPVELAMGTKTTIFPKTYMLPQPLTNSADRSRIPRIEITCWDGISYKDVDGADGKPVKTPDKQTLTGILYNNTTELIRWREGSDITYHLYLTDSSEHYIEFDASAEEWSYSGSTDIELK